jgi:5-formyltetrahydrofolate cyclo-ligase
MPKRSLRTATLAMRRELTPQQVAERSLALQRRFLSLREFIDAKVLALYAPVQQEVEFRRVAAMDQFASGRFGIPEPTGERVDPATAEVIVVPGIAFDLQGRRIGYGKGYYDRCLHRLEGRGRLIAFCYEIQLFEEIVGEPHDVAMDLIVTESRVVRVNKNIS